MSGVEEVGWGVDDGVVVCCWLVVGEVDDWVGVVEDGACVEVGACDEGVEVAEEEGGVEEAGEEEEGVWELTKASRVVCSVVKTGQEEGTKGGTYDAGLAEAVSDGRVVEGDEGAEVSGGDGELDGAADEDGEDWEADGDGEDMDEEALDGEGEGDTVGDGTDTDAEAVADKEEESGGESVPETGADEP